MQRKIPDIKFLGPSVKICFQLFLSNILKIRIGVKLIISITVCQEGVTMFMPIALNVLFCDEAFESGRVCHFYLGVCKNGSPFASWM